MHNPSHAFTLFRLQSICIGLKHMIHTKSPLDCLAFFSNFTKTVTSGEETAQNNNPLPIIPSNLYRISQQALTRSNRSLKGISKFLERTLPAQYLWQKHHTSVLDFSMLIHWDQVLKGNSVFILSASCIQTYLLKVFPMS